MGSKDSQPKRMESMKEVWKEEGVQVSRVPVVLCHAFGEPIFFLN